jgi:hypothetical protein
VIRHRVSPQFLLLVPALAAAQAPAPTPAPADIVAQRGEYARWLETSPVSPFAAIYHQPLDRRLVFGPGGDPALADLPAATLTEGSRGLTLDVAGTTRPVPRNRDVPLGGWRFRVAGEPGRSTVTVFGVPRDVVVPGWYPYSAAFVVDGSLEPAPRESRRMLGLDGVEVDASRVGTFVGRLAGDSIRLLVYRLPEPGTDQAELTIFFRDGTSGQGSYPAGRFLALRPLGVTRYRADFNRARNPFCAYNGVFPCPLPWPGNTITAAIAAGERYAAK